MNNKCVYLLIRGIRRFFKDFKPNIISLITLCTLIFVYHILFTAGEGASEFLKQVAEVKSIRVYIKTESVNDYQNILSQIKNINGVDKAIYYSPSDAKKYVAEKAPNVKGINSFSEDFFPSFIEIIPTETNNKTILDAISDETAKIKGVDGVSYGKEVMTKFLNVSRGATTFIIILSLLFIIATAFVLYNTVKLSLYKFREEIKLYSLVGATKSFISAPFAVSSIVMGIIAFAIASICFYFGMMFFNSQILYPAGINVMTIPSSTYFISLLIFICIVSAFAAMTSVKTFLSKVSSVNED